MLKIKFFKNVIRFIVILIEINLLFYLNKTHTHTHIIFFSNITVLSSIWFKLTIFLKEKKHKCYGFVFTKLNKFKFYSIPAKY